MYRQKHKAHWGNHSEYLELELEPSQAKTNIKGYSQTNEKSLHLQSILRSRMQTNFIISLIKKTTEPTKWYLWKQASEYSLRGRTGSH